MAPPPLDTHRLAARAARGGRAFSKWLWLAVAAFVGTTVAALTLMRPAPADLPALEGVPYHSAHSRDHIVTADTAARHDLRSASAIGALCLAYHADMYYQQALDCYASVLRLDADNDQWPYYRALAGSAASQNVDVAALWQHVTERSPSSLAWWWLGTAEYKAGRYDRAEQAWQRAAMVTTATDRNVAVSTTNAASVSHVSSVPFAAYPRLGLARIRLWRGDLAGARMVLEELIRTAPRFGAAFRLLADVYATGGAAADAERTTRQADRVPLLPIPIDPFIDSLARISSSSTFLLQQAKDTDPVAGAAWHEFLVRRAFEVDPDNPDVVFEMAILLRRQSKPLEALEQLRRYHDMVPEDYHALAQIGGCLSDLGRSSEAEATLRRAVAGPPDANTRYTLGVVLGTLGRDDEAAVEYARALAIDPNYISAHTNLAAVLLKKGRVAEAARHVARVIELDAGNAKAHANLGVVLMKQGRSAEARSAFTTALRLNPNEPLAQEGLRRLQQTVRSDR